MTAQAGYQFLIKIGDGASPEVFTTIGGQNTGSMTINREVIDFTNKDSVNRWRELMAGGIKSMSLNGAGVFKDTAAEESLRAAAAGDTIPNFQLIDGTGNKWQGPFLVTNYSLQAGNTDAENWSATLESAGEITYTAA